MDTFRAVFKHCEIGGGKPLQNTDFCGAIVVVHFWLPVAGHELYGFMRLVAFFLGCCCSCLLS